MCTYIAEIKASYTEVGRETSRVARKSFQKPMDLVRNERIDIDAFLDAINLITKDLNKVTQSVNDLVTVVRNNFCDITPLEAEELLQLSQPIIKRMQQLHKKIIASPLYKGMKTVVGLYEDAMRDFDELCHDLETFRIDLEQNDDFKLLLNRVSEMMNR